ncbi:MAG TPA: DUF1990 family protein [Candidatus Limnocylindrales bacterium]|jgi:uncharacterized protein (UPF0548 family)
MVRLALGLRAPDPDAVARWRNRPRTDEPRDGLRHDRHEVTVRVADDEADAAFEAARARLRDYRIFPPSVLRPTVDTPDGVVRDGALVVFRASLPPGVLSVEGAVRVLRTWDDESAGARETGFEIATLAGHPERGAEMFVVRLDRQARRLTLRIEAWSRPASALVRLGGPIGRRIQLRATRAAVAEFGSRAGTPPGAG